MNKMQISLFFVRLNKSKYQILSFVIFVSLVYRIFDLGVTNSYLVDELEREQRRSLTIAKYVRTDCAVIGKRIDGVSIFKKGAVFVIDSVEFFCMEIKYPVGKQLQLIQKY